jgi:nucleotide-binding universal stress UspA family protein
MSITDSKTELRKRTASLSAQRLPSESSPNPYRVLAVVDGSERTNHVVEFIKSLAACGSTIQVVVLNVQNTRHDHRLRGYQNFMRREIHERLTSEVGMPIVKSVTRWLEKLGVAAQGRVEIGEPIKVISKCAAEEHCDAIVIVADRPNAIRRFLANKFGIAFGTATSLIALSEHPAILVK